MEHTIKILRIEKVTHDVKRFVCERPTGYDFTPGQATEVSINKNGWKEEKRPFTFTALADAPYLEFTIKRYADHKGVTNEIHMLEPGDELIVRDVWGTINYQGPGYFIAGGAGITPFIAILRQLKKENNLDGNKLFFSNKTEEDIIIEPELTSMLKKNVIYTISNEKSSKYHNGHIDEKFLRENIDDYSKHFYLCGPPPMMDAVQEIFSRLGISPETIVFEL
jgi:ferredoxin-NADP reductase